MIPFIIYIKRNLKSLFFMFLLIIMPLSAVAYNYIGRNISAKPVIGMYFDCENHHIFDDISSETIDFREYYDIDSMKKDILTGNIDSGYIFDEKFDNAIYDLNFKNSIDYVTSKSSIVQPVANEFIFKCILQNIAVDIADRFFENKNIGLSIDKYYIQFLNSEKVFNIEFEEVDTGKNVENSFRLSNVFAVFIFIGCIISGLTVIKDRKHNINRYNYIYCLASAFLLTVSAVLAIIICGEFSFKNIPVYILYMVCISLFGFILSFVNNREFLCGMIPVFTILAFVFCPVVFDIGSLNNYYAYIGYILPPIYYVNGNLIGLVIYTIILGIIAFVLQKEKLK